MDWLRGIGEERRRAREMKRDLESRQAKVKIQLYLNGQRKMLDRLRDMARRALALGDAAQFERVGRQYLWTRENIGRWERYLLAVESVEVQVQQARLSGEFMRSLQGMSKSLLAGVGPRVVAQTEKDLQEGIARAQSMEQMLQYVADTMEQSIGSYQDSGRDEERTALRELESGLTPGSADRPPAPASAAGDAALEARVDAGLERLEQAMRTVDGR